MGADSTLVLVVDDERDIADTYSHILSEDYEVKTAYGGEEALDLYNEEIDIVLLDRRMPDKSGDEVLEEIRERPGESRVAMVTAVNPDFDVLEMGFDAYLTKPVSAEALYENIEQLLTRSTYEDEVQEYFALVTKRATLEAEKSRSDLESSERYQALLDDIEVLEARLDETVADLTMDDYAAAIRDIQN
jgi:two-component system response regulator AdeR